VSEDGSRGGESAEPQSAVIKLGASLRIQDVAASHHLLERTLEGGTPVRIDLGELTDVDTAGVQLLAAYGREAARRGIELRWSGETAALLKALRLLGMSGSLPGLDP
jgi:phospholipid transport system transporter-binding protein